MIDRQTLLADLQKLLGKLEADLIERSDSADVPEIGKTLRSEYDEARKAERTAQSYEEWKTGTATQMAAAWVLSCVFVRFLEDNKLIDPPMIAGPADRLQRARDEQELYFREHPRETDRDYLLSVFDVLAALPGTKDVFGQHNPVRELPNWLSGDAAGVLLRFFQKIDADTGMLVHDFTDAAWDTRFLGDLYQDLSKAARKKYALLQTPDFVEEFILDRTLDPALEEFGLDAPPVTNNDLKPVTTAGFRMIDPACGSGHFLLGSFRRILNRWQKKEPGAKVRDLVQRTLDSINGVDLNPYAVAVARFRLLLAAMQACDVTRLADAPAFQFNLACGDSLLHGVVSQGFLGDMSPIAHHFQSEDIDTLRRLLFSGQYHAVVANPPYITPKDRALNEAYRKRYSTCHMKYSLSVPFMERIFILAVDGGFTGQITANSFTKREFGKKLIENFIRTLDLTHVIDTSGAYLPGHGTPTLILFGRRREPTTRTLRTVFGIRNEPSTPKDPERGLVWSAILEQTDRPGSPNPFVSAADSLREPFGRHPWSIGGGGAAELKQRLDDTRDQLLTDLTVAVGPMAITALDEVFIGPSAYWRRCGIGTAPYVTGDSVRDWHATSDLYIAFPYEESLECTAPDRNERFGRRCWPYRTLLIRRTMFGKTTLEAGLRWYEYRYFEKGRALSGIRAAFACVATHNHFSQLKQGRVANRHAPVVQFKDGTSDDTFYTVLGLMNSSTACFWMQQVFHNKGRPGAEAAAADEPWEFRFEHDSTKLERFPILDKGPSSLARKLNVLADELGNRTPQSVLNDWTIREESPSQSLSTLLHSAYKEYEHIRGRMITFQEELDWQCYVLYGLTSESTICYHDPPSLQVGERAFEILLARKTSQGELDTAWFDRLNAQQLTAVRDDWPPEYQGTVLSRIAMIEANPEIKLVEQQQFKRRWQVESWASQVQNALRNWLLDRLESHFYSDKRLRVGGSQGIASPTLISVARVVEIARRDADFLEVGLVYRDDSSFDVHRLVTELVESESVPLLPVILYKESGLMKRSEWEYTWELQRREDAIDARSKIAKDNPKYVVPEEASDFKQREIGGIPAPPKYTGADFLEGDYWRLRGKLDVPKERWVSFPHCEGQDGTLVVAWAGYDHLQLARAISSYYVDIQERQGGRDDARLVPLLACVIELLPWIKQWHNEPDPNFSGMRMGDYFDGFVQDEARQMGKTIDEVKAWKPPQRSRTPRKRR